MVQWAEVSGRIFGGQSTGAAIRHERSGFEDGVRHYGRSQASISKTEHTYCDHDLTVVHWDAGRDAGHTGCDEGGSGDCREEPADFDFARAGKVLRTYKVALGGAPVGQRSKQGDHKTPEGHYILDRRNPKSRFYKSIHVSYPNQQDKKRASQRGVSTGGDIMVHGLPNGFGWLGATHRNETGPMAASRLRMRRWMRSGNWCRTGRRLKSGRKFMAVSGITDETLTDGR